MKFTEDVLQRNDLIYNVLPPRWVFGLPIGNGQIGGMIWVEDETKVVVTLDSVWAWDYRQTPIQDPQTNNYARFRELMAAGDEESADRFSSPGGCIPRRRTWGAL